MENSHINECAVLLIDRLLTYVLGIQVLPHRAKTLIHKAVITTIFIQFFFGLSNTFFVLFVIESVGYELLGILIAISFIVQAVLDYPTGVIGDWIGQKWLLLSAYISFGLSFAIIFFSDSLTSLFISYCLSAFAASQASGALQTWIDNNYKVSAGEIDPERKIYSFFVGRWGMTGNLALGISFVTGGFLATIYSRQVVFGLQAILLVILALSFLFYIDDFPEVERAERSVSNYFRLLGGGLQAVFLNKTLLLFITGMCLQAAMWTIWGSMILFPMYYGYTGSDGGASLFRFFIFIIIIPIAGLSANFAVKLKIKNYPVLIAIHTVIFFGGMMFVTALFPFMDWLEPRFEPVALLLLFIVFFFPNILYNSANILQQRLFLDLIPDTNRNAVYSLVPTLILLVNSPTVIIGGQLLKNNGLTVTLWILGLIGLIGTIFFYLAIRTIPVEVERSEELGM